MSNHKEEIVLLAKEFESSQKILSALGDENRQHLILEMMKMGDCDGVRVGAITEKTNLSRPAVSHHLQILKEAGILKMRRDGTKNYYYAGSGFYTKLDLGIAKYHFEIGAGKNNFDWIS